MKNKEHVYSYLVQETDLDFLGHVNNATYVKIYEQARWQLIHDRGFTFQKISEVQQSPIILEINVKYLKELNARTPILIKTHLLKYSGKIGQLRQVMEHPNQGIIYSEAHINFGLFDMKNRRLIEPTEEWLNVLK